MPTTFKTAGVTAKKPARTGLEVIEVVGEYELTAALTINDVIQMVNIPVGARILGGQLATDDLDTNGTPLITLAVGDDGDDDRFLLANNVARAGGVVSFDRVDGINYVYTANGTINVKCIAAPATGTVTGTIRVTVRYTMNQGF